MIKSQEATLWNQYKRKFFGWFRDRNIRPSREFKMWMLFKRRAKTQLEIIKSSPDLLVMTADPTTNLVSVSYKGKAYSLYFSDTPVEFALIGPQTMREEKVREFCFLTRNMIWELTKAVNYDGAYSKAPESATIKEPPEQLTGDLDE